LTRPSRLPAPPSVTVQGVPVAIRSPTSVPSSRTFCICDLLREFSRTIASPRCCSTVSHRRLFRFLFRCAAPPFLPPARKKSVFPTIRRRRKLSVTNVTRLDFIFVMSDTPNANRSPFSAGLPNWHSAGTARGSRGSATQILERPTMKPCRSTLNGAPRARVLRYR
jgi:hypothetical protein